MIWKFSSCSCVYAGPPLLPLVEPPEAVELPPVPLFCAPMPMPMPMPSLTSRLNRAKGADATSVWLMGFKGTTITLFPAATSMTMLSTSLLAPGKKPSTNSSGSSRSETTRATCVPSSTLAASCTLCCLGCPKNTTCDVACAGRPLIIDATTARVSFSPTSACGELSPYTLRMPFNPVSARKVSWSRCSLRCSVSRSATSNSLRKVMVSE
mmetsp:Transcript_27999/g.70281  ORF Transcript_27999/g.70281 Transcript_27999/m.70281 type:complete len:210 (-) Transcript_27999:910-1539(-)